MTEKYVYDVRFVDSYEDIYRVEGTFITEKEAEDFMEECLDDCMLSMLQSNLYLRTADTMAVPYYGLNKEYVNVYEKPKKKITIYDLDRLIFPFDPIRDWVEKEVKRINEKYAWAEELSGRRALEGRNIYERYY